MPKTRRFLYTSITVLLVLAFLMSVWHWLGAKNKTASNIKCIEQAKKSFVTIVEKRVPPLSFEEYVDTKRAYEERMKAFQKKDRKPFPSYYDELLIAKGSRTIIENDGLILSAAHLLLNTPSNPQFTILYAQRKYDAHIVAVDHFHDLLLLKIEPPKESAVLEVKKVLQLQIGEEIFALGNPTDGLNRLPMTVSHGIVSNLHMFLTQNTGNNSYITNDDMIVTDASVLSGNSGGPFFRCQKEKPEFVAMITSVLGKFSFGVSSGTIINELEQLKENAVTHGFLGIGVIDLKSVSPQFKFEHNISLKENGFLINELYEGGGAVMAGLLPNDVISTINGQTFSDLPAAVKYVGSKKKNEKVILTIKREKISFQKEIILGDRSERFRLNTEL